SVKIIEQAIVPFEPIGSSKMLVMLMACFMSIFLGFMLAFVFEYMDQTFKSEKEVENYLNLPFLGSNPAKPRSKSVDGLAEQIQRIAKDKNIKTLLFATAGARENPKDLVANIGSALSEKGRNKILFIDSNFRHRPLKMFFGRSASGPGLVEVIEGKAILEKTVQTVGKNLSVLSIGETQLNPITVVDSTRMNALLNDAGHKYDLILISAPDLTQQVSVQLAAHVDGIILVVSEGTTRKQAAKYAITSLKKTKSTILGTILNNRTFPIPKFIYNRV
ncbi:MAG: hypothetical protein KAR32_00180, partial [Candidatus Omnitrophica bacterium]|nr:hypothetical protein [Candidatus Omnitrophota bacterium]